MLPKCHSMILPGLKQWIIKATDESEVLIID